MKPIANDLSSANYKKLLFNITEHHPDSKRELSYE
jgi:hypothetical protein